MIADLIVTDARVLTMDAAMPRAEAVAISAGRILAVGTRAEIEALAGPRTAVIAARGRTLLPGFFESHLHLFGGAELAHLQLTGVTGAAALAAAFRAHAAARPDLPLVLAQGADYAMLGHPITRADLDAVIADRPIAMQAYDHHTVWANTAALKAAGIFGGALLTPGHEVVMGADGLAVGELREFEAFAPVMAVAGEARMYLGIATGREPDPQPTAAERAADRAKFARGLAHCARHGITSAVTMDGNRYTLELLREMQAEGLLPVRVKVPFHLKPDMDLSELARAQDMTRDFDDDWLCSGFVKMFMDGVMDSRTAFRLDDYPGHPGHRGSALFTAPAFDAAATEIDRRGLQMAVHAIGDAAVRRTLDGYGAARAANGARDSRHRVEHIELIDRADVPRLSELGAVASLQPAHLPGAMDFAAYPALDVVGAGRLRDSFLTRTLLDLGVPVAFASDWPITDVAVLRNLQAALTRQPFPGCGDERATLVQALHACTAGGAWAAHREHVTGRIVTGLAADLVLLGGDIEATEPEEVGAMGIALTVCGGRITHRGPDLE